MKLSNTSIVLILLVCLSLGFNLILPFFDKNNLIFNTNQMVSKNKILEPTAVCFIAGTKISTACGYKNIEDVKIGDLVLSYNFSTHKTEYKHVIQMMAPYHNDIVQFTFSNGVSSKHTYDHPYWTVNKGWSSYRPDWTYERYNIETAQIKEGDVCLNENNNSVTLTDIDIVDMGTVRTYNFFVEDNHDYYADGILVHNKVAPSISLLNIDYTINANWDTDNNDASIDITWADADTGGQMADFYITFGIGSAARNPMAGETYGDPEDGDYDWYSTGNAEGTYNNIDVNWINNVASWTDYSGTIYIKALVYDNEAFSPRSSIVSDTLTSGIDGTAPTLTDIMSAYAESGDTTEAYADTSTNKFYFSNSFSSSATCTFTCTASDATSGVKSVDYSNWGNNPSADTSAPYQGAYTVDNADTSGTITVTIIDNAGNTLSNTGTLTCTEDDTTPATSTNVISSYIQLTSPLDITATASDASSGMQNVHLWYKYAVDNSSWGSWTDFGTDTGSPWSWSFTFPDSYGYYEFYTRGTDNVANYENAPGSADTKCRYLLPYFPEWRMKQSGWNNFSNTASWQTEQSGWNNFSNTASWQTEQSGWNNFSNTASWQTEQSGWNNFENSLSWSNLEQGWNTFGNESLWTDIEQGWNTFGNNSYMVIDYIFPDDGDLICPTCYLNDTFFYFGVGVNHRNGTLMNITWTTWNGTLLGQLTNVGNGTWHIIPFETVMSIEYDHLYNYTINVTDGVDNIEKIISFSTDTYANCDTMNFIFDTAQMGAFVTIFLFAFFMWIGYTSQKRSGGAFMLVSGFMLIYLGIVLVPYTSAIYVIPLITPIAIFIIMIGIRKWLYPPEKEKTKTEGQ